MTIKEFLEVLNRYRVVYFGLEECKKEKLSESELREINEQQKRIRQIIADFVLY